MKTEVSVEQNATLKDNAFAALFGVSPGALSLLLVEARDGSQRASSDERFLGLRRQHEDLRLEARHGVELDGELRHRGTTSLDVSAKQSAEWRRVLTDKRLDLFRNGFTPETEPRRTIDIETVSKRYRNGPETGRTEHVSINYRVQIISEAFRYC